MIDVFICCGGEQAEAAQRLQKRLEQTAEARVRVEVCDEEQTVLELWDEGLSGQAILLLLSPDGVPAKADRAVWSSVLEHAAGRMEPALGVVVMEACAFPPLLKRASLFRGDGWSRELARDLQAWLIGLHPSQGASFEPAALMPEMADEAELEESARLLLDGAGSVTVAESRIAQMVARQALPHFREVIWVSCAGRATACLAGELAWALGVRLEGTEADAWQRIGELLAEHRVLVVLDGAPATIPELAGETGRGCVVRTAPRADAVVAADSDWEAAIAACRPAGFPLELALRIAGEAGPGSGGELIPIDAQGKLFRSLRTARATAAMQRRHAEALNEIFLQWRDVDRCRVFATEVESALDWAHANDWGLAVSLTNRAGNFFKLCERRFEAAYMFEQLSEAARARGDGSAVSDCEWELSWLRHGEGEVRASWETREQLSLFGDSGF